MKHLLPYILLIVAFVSNITDLKADTEFQLTQFTTADGLANNTVRHILQDSKGRLWISTMNGLSRYDGNEFVNFAPNRDSHEISLPSRKMKRTLERNGMLWISTGNGLACYDINNDRFVDYSKKNTDLPTFPTTYYDVRTIVDKQGRTWKVTENDGLYIINNKTGEIEHFTTSTKNSPLPTNALKCIFQDKEGVIWIGTDNLGLSQIKVVQNDGVKYMMEGENIRMLMHLGKDRIAVGNRSGDMWIYDSSLKKVLSTTKREKSTYCILLDKDSTLWEGTKGAGIYINGEHKADSPFIDIYSMHKDKKGDLWIGTFGAGLFHKGKAYLTNDADSKYIRSIAEDKYGNLWVATSNGVYVMNDIYKGKTDITHISTKDGNLYSNELRSLFIDSNGNIYLAETGEGFAIVDGNKYNKNREIALKHYTDKDSLINTMVQSFVEDNDGFIWIATEFGISKFNLSTETKKSYFFSKNMLNNIYSENCGIRLDNGHIAFGTNNGIIIITPSVYNKGEKTTDISADDVTVNGQKKSGIVYVMSKWWKSPWAIMCYVAIIILIFFIRRKIKRDNSRFHKAIKELNQKKDELVSEKDQLVIEKEKLNAENEVIKDQYSAEVRIRRQEEINSLDEEFINKVESITNREMARADFSADEFAEMMGMGRTVFFNKMKKITGYSPKEYIKLKRIKRAAELISTTSKPIGEIGFIVGIEDPLYFSRVFKQAYGMTPTEWRKNGTQSKE